MVYLFLADGFEEIEALCPCDMLRRAGVKVKTVSITDSHEVCGSHGICVSADMCATDKFEDFDMLILPGGMPGASNLDLSPLVDSMIKKAVEGDKYISAICAAPMILGKRGLLYGREAICFSGFEKYLEGAIISEQKVVVDGKYITAIGMGASIDFSLKLVEIFCGKEKADTLSHMVCYK